MIVKNQDFVDLILQSLEMDGYGEKSSTRLQVMTDKARETTEKIFNKKIYLRGLIEISNECQNNCYYCGIRRNNTRIQRYRLTEAEILDSVHIGKMLGFHTYVLQGGEGVWSDVELQSILRKIKEIQPSCAVTLSLGERSWESFQLLKKSGADRYLLRHETCNEKLYRSLHPRSMSLSKRLQSLKDLKELHFQVGSGFMIGVPGQTPQHIVEDLRFLKALEPAMIGIGPYVSHHDTPFRNCPNGSVDQTIILISILRLMFPKANIPATTSLQTLAKDGRSRAILAGANVFMPNLTPAKYRKEYSLYDNKACFEMEAAENLIDLKREIEKIGNQVDMGRGDYQGNV